MRLARLGFVPVLGLLPLAGFGCSDPVPPTPRAAWSVSWVDPGDECNIQGHNRAMGSVSVRTKELLLVDGQDDADIECSVSGSGSFTVSANASVTTEAGYVYLQILASGITAQATKEAPAVGAVVFSSDKTAGDSAVSDSANPCQFWFAPDSGQGIGAGKIGVSFMCPRMLLDENNKACNIAQGYAIFENCGS